MNQAAAIARLLRVGDSLAAGELPPPEDCTALVTALRRYVGREFKSTDEAFGVSSARGIGDARDAYARQTRDDWYRKAAAIHGKTAKEITKIQHDYIDRGSWERDREETKCPARLRDTVQGCIWHGLKAWPREIGEKQIAAILGSQMPDLTSDDSC